MTDPTVLTLASQGVPTDERSLVAYVDGQVGQAAIDCVIDDGGRDYAHLRTAFEVAFPRLRPGGRYEIRGWAWAHTTEAGEPDRPAATNLLVEMLALVGSGSDAARELVVESDVAVVVRGGGALGSPFRLAHTYRNRGIPIRPLL